MWWQLLGGLRRPVRAARLAAEKLRTLLLFHRYAGRVREPRGQWPPGGDEEERADEVARQLKAAGFVVRDLHIDLAEQRRYLAAAGYQRFPAYYGGGRHPLLPEKALEHYLAARLLELSPGDVYLDVASGASPAAEIYARLYGCTAHRQDPAFGARRGRSGASPGRIGGWAGALPVPDGFATKLGLHCSFEHFEGDEDVRFLKEAGRVLRPGGKACIVPLYLHTEYAILTDPVLVPDGGRRFDEDARLCCARGWGCRHGRHYDAAHLQSRVRENLGGLLLTIYRVRNVKEVHARCYARFVALLERPLRPT